jgi:alkylation response protein AidB-like acyl-CoA dehydrogenase
MSLTAAAPAEAGTTLTLPQALAQIAAGAGALDREPRFPHESFDALREAGVVQLAADRSLCTLEREVATVRALAAADASCARILDGHFNGAERIAMLAPPALREHELGEVAAGRLLIGVWGADPVGDEGAPASIGRGPDGAPVLRGVKTFCSGAGGVQRALVLAGDEDGARRVVYLDTARGVEVDRSWYRASGLRASESHRVEFHDTPILALLGGPGELIREPWFSRDALRTTATWAGIADCVLQATLSALRPMPADDLRLHALGRMRVAMGTIDVWLTHAVERLERPTGDVRPLAAQARLAIFEACRLISSEAARVCGSRALVDGGALDRSRRDLDLFLLQHRLDPKLVELGREALEEPAR